MSEQLLWPILGVFAPLVIATMIAYFLLRNDGLHTRGKH